MNTLRLHALKLCIVVEIAISFKAASSIDHPVALIVLNTAGGANEFSPVLEYAKVDFESAVALKGITPEGRTVSLPRDQIALVFQYPNPAVTLSGAADNRSLSAKRAEAAALASRYPKAEAALDRVIAGIDTDLHQPATSQVRYGGVWQNALASATSTNTGVDLASFNYPLSGTPRRVRTALISRRVYQHSRIRD
jgi:hypothetical protein